MHAFFDGEIGLQYEYFPYLRSVEGGTEIQPLSFFSIFFFLIWNAPSSLLLLSLLVSALLCSVLLCCCFAFLCSLPCIVQQQILPIWMRATHSNQLIHWIETRKHSPNHWPQVWQSVWASNRLELGFNSQSSDVNNCDYLKLHQGCSFIYGAIHLLLLLICLFLFRVTGG